MTIKINNENIIIFVAIAFLLIFVSQYGVSPIFSIVTKTVCMDNEISYYNMDNGDVAGKFGNAYEFNTTNFINIPEQITANATTMWIKDYSLGDTSYHLLADLNGLSYVDGIRDNSRTVLPLGEQFGLGFNGSVDDVSTFSELSLDALAIIYKNGTGSTICYTETYEENITCREYSISQLNDTGTGCINYAGNLFPNCEYSWESTDTYQVVNGICVRQLYCIDGGLTLIECNTQVSSSTSSSSSSSSSTSDTYSVTDSGESDETFRDKLNKKVFTILDFDITLFHLIILAGILGLYLYYIDSKKK